MWEIIIRIGREVQLSVSYFDREELDRVLANGDHKRGRGRPRGVMGGVLIRK